MTDVVLPKTELLERVARAVAESGYQSIIISGEHPFLLRVFREEDPAYENVRVYIWNCTHGGHGRALDEYRVQLTPARAVPTIRAGEITLLLGWHEGYEVFVGFDVAMHAGQRSSSPSIQVKEAALLDAHERAFAAYERANAELVICFRPEFLVDYLRNAAELHKRSGNIARFAHQLSEIDRLTEDEIREVQDLGRREVIATIKRRYRQADFRDRVLAAYGNRCSMCAVQLDLVEAAHILPVAAEGSTDDTGNGIALCAIHHKAFDRALVSFNESYVIEVSATALQALTERRLFDGASSFRQGLKPAIGLPLHERDNPKAPFIALGRKVRLWRP